MASKRLKCFFTLTVYFFVSVLPAGAGIPGLRATVTEERLSDVGISPFIFGNFIEAGFGRQVSGMWAEMIYNRSFVLPGTFPAFGDVSSTRQWWMFPKEMYNESAPFWHSGYEENDWYPTDPARVRLSRTRGTESFKGNDSLLLTKDSPDRGGICQRGIFLEAGRSYDFYLLGGVRNSLPKVSSSLTGFTPHPDEGRTKPFELIIRDEKQPDSVLFRQTFRFQGFQEYHRCRIPDLGHTGRVIVELSYDWIGNVALSCCSLMPADNIHGWRKDVVGLLKELRVPVIRYPGGCYASFFNWRNYVGPRDFRPASYSYYWGGLDDNDASVDEFLSLCEEIGCEPQMCINMMTSTPFKAAEFVEYLNGDDDSPMGRFRRQNGIEKRRKVRLFEMDNEAGRKWTALQYAEQVVRFAEAMKAVDPEIELMMMDYSFAGSDHYLDQMLAIAGEHIDYLIARNGSPGYVVPLLARLRAFNSAHGTHIRLVNTEWLPGSDAPEPFDDPEIPQHFRWTGEERNDYRQVLSFRQIRWFYALNGAAQLLDYLSYGGDYYLANFNNCTNTWGQNVIEASKEAAWLSPMGEVFRFFAKRGELYPLVSRLSGVGEKKGRTRGANQADKESVDFPLMVNTRSQNEILKLAACETADGILVYLVNKSRDAQTLTLEVPASFRRVSQEILSAPDRLSRSGPASSDILFEERILKDGPIPVPPLSINRFLYKKENR